jgi:hypothetical protein
MDTVALVTWMGTVLAGLVLLIIWLMEYDREFQTGAHTRLPVPLISSHALLGIGGLLVWAFYVVTDEDKLGQISAVDLGIVATLGLTMAYRWIQVYRQYAKPGSSPTRLISVPPERHFPRPVILIHGLLALATIGLVVFTVFFGS